MHCDIRGRQKGKTTSILYSILNFMQENDGVKIAYITPHRPEYALTMMRGIIKNSLNFVKYNPKSISIKDSEVFFYTIKDFPRYGVEYDRVYVDDFPEVLQSIFGNIYEIAGTCSHQCSNSI